MSCPQFVQPIASVRGRLPQSYPLADLLQAARISELPDEAVGELLGTSKRTVTRWHLTGVPVDASERAAIALGEVPEAVWFTWLEDMVARDEARQEARRVAAANRSARRRERRRRVSVTNPAAAAA